MSIENYRNVKKMEFAAANSEKLSTLSGIVFVKLAEKQDIDDVTATEYIDLFVDWSENTDYKVNDIRKYNNNLYRCLQAHKSQEGWEPESAASLWKKIGDPTVEYPEWSQPITAEDAYMKDDKVSHKDTHWISTTDNNVWEPGVYGWDMM